MSTETPAVQAASAPKLTSIQLIEQEIANFLKQREQAAKQAEQAVANVHAVDGAIQGAKFLLAKLQQAAQAAEAEGKKLAEAVVTEVEKGIHAVETEEKQL